MTLFAQTTIQLAGAETYAVEKVLEGHQHVIEAVAWSPDGSMLASGSDDRTAIVWNATDGSRLFTLSGHNNTVCSLSWSPDGKRLVSGSWNRSAIVWDTATGKQLFSLEGHGSSVWSVSWSPDGKKLATGSADRLVKIWDAATGHFLMNLTGHTEIVYCVVWSPDGSSVASCSVDKTIKVWNAMNGTLSKNISAGDMVSCIAWSPDGKQIASGYGAHYMTPGADTSISIWDAGDGRKISSLTGHSEKVMGLSWSSNGTRIASASWDGTVKVWNATSGQQVFSVQLSTEMANAVAWSPDCRRLACGVYDDNVRIFAGDCDGDGHPDSLDLFPSEPTQWADYDGDGHGDNPKGADADKFPYDRTQWRDSDKDGYGDDQSGSNPDAFPQDPSQWRDTDGDGHGDNRSGTSPDLFPADATQWNDTDGDGHGDNSSGNTPDRFPADATQWSDTDGDGHGDNRTGNSPDLFPDDPARWEGTVAQNHTGGLIWSDSLSYAVAGTILIAGLVAGVAGYYFTTKKKDNFPALLPEQGIAPSQAAPVPDSAEHLTIQPLVPYRAPVAPSPGSPTMLTVHRDWSYVGGSVRLCVTTTNRTPETVGDVRLRPVFNSEAFILDRVEPADIIISSGEARLGDLKPDEMRQCNIYLDPLICSTSDIEAVINYRDSNGKLQTMMVPPVKVPVVCPLFFPPQEASLASVKNLLETTLDKSDTRVYSIPQNLEPARAFGLVKEVVGLHSIRHLRDFFKDGPWIAEGWFYGLAGEGKNPFVILIRTFGDAKTMAITAYSQGLSSVCGLLSELHSQLNDRLRDGRYITNSLKQITNIEIRDSIINRSSILAGERN